MSVTVYCCPSKHMLPETNNVRPTHKLYPRYLGPYVIENKISDVVYALDLPENMHIHLIFHTSKFKRYHSWLEEPNADKQMPLSIIVNDHKEWEVEDVLTK
jgi:hypothetical protein